MAKTDWGLNDIVRPQDMNDIGEELNQLRTDVDNIEVPPASLTQAGIVQLSNATDGTSENKAPTEKALGLVMAEAQAGKQAGIERKNEVVAALNSIGVSASTSESWDSLITKMAAIIKATGNAVAADVLSGKTFSNAGANNLTGTMPNRGAGGTVTPTTTNQMKAAGYYSSAITILGEPNLIAANLPKDKTFWGIVGSLERMTTAEKQSIVNAITSKGVPASINDSNAVLAQKIGQITAAKYGSQDVNMSESLNIPSNNIYIYKDIATIPAGVTMITFVTTSTSNVPDSRFNSTSGSRKYIILTDDAGRDWSLSLTGSSILKIVSLYFSKLEGMARSNLMDSFLQHVSSIPAGFNSNGPMKLKLGFVNESGSTDSLSYVFKGKLVYQ